MHGSAKFGLPGEWTIHLPISKLSPMTSPARPVCLITGAATGIGAACARTFASHGWDVGICSLDDDTRSAAEAVAAERWMIEGNYGSVLPPRLERADTVIYLDFPIRLCLKRLIKRIVTNRGQSRPDMPEGCPERFDLGFFWYVMNWNSGPRVRTEATLAGYSGTLIRLTSPAALAEWRAQSGLA